MTNICKGVVERTFSKDFGNSTLYSFTLKGQTGFFGTGNKNVVEQGKAYEFEYTIDPKNRRNVNLSTLRPWEAGEALANAPVASFTRRSGNSNFNRADAGKDDYWRAKEARDIQNDKLRELGATRNTAIALVGLMLQNGAVKLPAKEANKEEVIYALVEHYVDVLMKGKKEEAPTEANETSAPTAGTADDSEGEWK